MADKKKVNLAKAMTWGGVNYVPGSQELPAAAADYAVRRKFGTIGGKTADAAETETIESGGGNAGGTGESGLSEIGLPEDFPMKHVFEKAGFNSVEDIHAKSREDLIAIDGIAEKTADKALAYGK